MVHWSPISRTYFKIPLQEIIDHQTKKNSFKNRTRISWFFCKEKRPLEGLLGLTETCSKQIFRMWFDVPKVVVGLNILMNLKGFFYCMKGGTGIGRHMGGIPLFHLHPNQYQHSHWFLGREKRKKHLTQCAFHFQTAPNSQQNGHNH